MHSHIQINHSCQNKCLFCATGGMTKVLSYGDIIEFLAENLHTHDTILITGGEPTVHPDFVDIVRHIKEAHTDIKVDILTNAISFADHGFVDRVSDYIDVAHCSFYSFSERITTYLTKNPHAFNDTCKGISNIIDGGIRYDIRTLINIRTTYRTLDRTTDTIYKLFDPPIIIYSGVDPCGGIKNYPQLMVSLMAASPHLTDAIDTALRSGIEPHLMFYPLCLVQPRFRSRVVSDVCNRDIDAFFSECDADMNPEKYDNAYATRCDMCGSKDRCTGVWRRYLLQQTDTELKPIEG